jgi:hypothetical protein
LALLELDPDPELELELAVVPELAGLAPLDALAAAVSHGPKLERVEADPDEPAVESRSLLHAPRASVSAATTTAVIRLMPSPAG